MLIKPTVVAIAGTIASGKTTAAHWLESQYNAYITRASKHLRLIASERGLGTDREALQKLSYELRQEFGKDYLANLVCNELDTVTGHNLFVIDVRRVADVMKLFSWARAHGYHFQLIFIKSTLEISWKRDCVRRMNNGEETLSQEEFWLSLQHECEQEIHLLQAMTPQYAIVRNFGNNLSSFQQSISHVLELPHPKAAVI